MLLSIIIPVRNRAHIISETLNSLKVESFKDIEIIVVDNNSSDHLIEIIKKYKKVKYIKNKLDKERSYSRNLGIKNSTGKYLTFLDSDDLFDSSLLKYFIKCKDKYKNDSFYFINFNYLKDNKVVNNSNIFKKKFCHLSDLFNENKISNIGIIIKKELAKENFWDENKNIIGTEDYDYVLRLMIKAERAVLIDKKPLGFVRIHDGRSIYQDEKIKILRRFYYFKKKLLNSKVYANIKINNKKKIIATQSIYTSLLLSNCGEKKKSLYFLIYTIKNNFFAIFSKRFLYLIYRLLFIK